MPYDTNLAARITRAVRRWKNTESKKMFGGICHLISGNMYAGVYKDYLIVRVGPAQYVDALKKPYTSVFDITGKVMKGWVMVAPPGVATDTSLKTWLEKGKTFAQSLPAK